MRLVTPKEAAAAVGVHPRTMCRWARANRIRHYRLPHGRELRVFVDEHGLPVPAELRRAVA